MDTRKKNKKKPGFFSKERQDARMKAAQGFFGANDRKKKAATSRLAGIKASAPKKTVTAKAKTPSETKTSFVASRTKDPKREMARGRGRIKFRGGGSQSQAIRALKEKAAAKRKARMLKK